jgi:hypothetical protein
VREHVPTACRIGTRLAPVRGGLLHERRCGVRGAPPEPLHSGPDALAGDRTGDEEDLPFVARDHAPAGGRLLDHQRQFVVN